MPFQDFTLVQKQVKIKTISDKHKTQSRENTGLKDIQMYTYPVPNYNLTSSDILLYLNDLLWSDTNNKIKLCKL